MPRPTDRPTTGAYDHEFDDSRFDEPTLDESLFDIEAPLASPWTRLSSVVLNVLIVIGVAIPGSVLLGAGEERGSEILAGLGGLILFISLGGLIVYQAVLLSREGQSLGKRILHLRIVDAHDDSNPGFARVILARYVLMQVLSFVPLVGLIDALMIFSEDHKTLRDRLAGTVVVNERGL